MTFWLRIALAAQVAFFAAWGGYLATSHRDAPTVWVATEPVDPRDMLSGYYVALRFRIASAREAGCPPVSEDTGPVAVYVGLRESGETILTDAGPVAIWEAASCTQDPPEPQEGDRWITGWLGSQDDSDRIAYGIERFYVGETNTLREATSGSVVAELAINDDFQARISRLERVQSAQPEPTAVP